MDWVYRGFGARVRQARRGRWTQEELAGRVGLSRTSIANVEAGRQRVPLHMLFVLARELGVAPEALLPNAEEETGTVRADLIASYPPDERRLFARIVGRANGDERETDDEE